MIALALPTIIWAGTVRHHRTGLGMKTSLAVIHTLAHANQDGSRSPRTCRSAGCYLKNGQYERTLSHMAHHSPLLTLLVADCFRTSFFVDIASRSSCPRVREDTEIFFNNL